jgi:hypothetical protein
MGELGSLQRLAPTLCLQAPHGKVKDCGVCKALRRLQDALAFRWAECGDDVEQSVPAQRSSDPPSMAFLPLPMNKQCRGGRYGSEQRPYMESENSPQLRLGPPQEVAQSLLSIVQQQHFWLGWETYRSVNQPNSEAAA